MEVSVRAVLVSVALGSSGCLAAWSPCQPDDDSLVAGGGFESLQCWEDGLDNWEADVRVDDASGTPGEEPAMRVDNPLGHAMSVAQKGGNALMRDTLFVEEGSDVAIRLLVKAESAGRPYEVTLRDASDPVTVLRTFSQTATADWEVVDLAVGALPEGDVELVLGVGGADKATLWLDDVRLIAVEIGD